MKKSLATLGTLLITLMVSTSIYALDNLPLQIDFEAASNYTSDDLYEINNDLVMRYPDILEIEILGYSYDANPIYVIRLGENLKEKTIYVTKMHGLIESGTHSREVANPVITSSMLRDYVMDYYDDSHLEDVNMGDILKSSVFHFVINSNPDGYNISKFGAEGLTTESAYTTLLSIGDYEFSDYKANSRGVDLNRNYPDIYYDTQTNQWVDIWNIKRNNYNSDVPSGAYYFGEYAGSEVETQIMMAYLLSYDFRFYLSYHSKGEVIYGNYTQAPLAARRYINQYANIASEITGYAIPDVEEAWVSSGYMGDYVVNNTLKPNITIETISTEVTLPDVSGDDIIEAYNLTYSVPYEFMELSISKGYFKYKLYVDGQYIRDYDNKEYAYAIADKMGGTIIIAEGIPALTKERLVTREEFVESMMKLIPIDEDFNDYSAAQFNDTDSQLVHYAKYKGIVKGHDNFFSPSEPISYLESAIILYRIDKVLNKNMYLTPSNSLDTTLTTIIPDWALAQVMYGIEMDYLPALTDFKQILSREDYNSILEKYVF